MFLANMKVFLRGEPQNEPSSRPLREVGKAEDAGQRIEQQKGPPELELHDESVRSDRERMISLGLPQ